MEETQAPDWVLQIYQEMTESSHLIGYAREQHSTSYTQLDWFRVCLALTHVMHEALLHGDILKTPMICVSDHREDGLSAEWALLRLCVSEDGCVRWFTRTPGVDGDFSPTCDGECQLEYMATRSEWYDNLRPHIIAGK